MAELNFFLHDDSGEERLELLEGELITMPPPGWPHMLKVNLMTAAFVRAAGDDGVVSIQNGVVISRINLPMPDLVLFDPKINRGRKLPTVADILLLVEVSDSTLRYDVKRKLPVYARFGVPEVWHLDVRGRTLTRYLEPTERGYLRKDELHGRVAPQRLPSCVVDVEPFLVEVPEDDASS